MALLPSEKLGGGTSEWTELIHEGSGNASDSTYTFDLLQSDYKEYLFVVYETANTTTRIVYGSEVIAQKALTDYLTSSNYLYNRRITVGTSSVGYVELCIRRLSDGSCGVFIGGTTLTKTNLKINFYAR